MNAEALDLCRQTAEAVLESMFFETLVDSPSTCADPQNVLRAEARFSGTDDGSLQIAADEFVARRLAANFLGEDDTSVSDQQIRDTLCELANIYCGCLMSHAKPNGRIRISSPEIVSGAADGREWVQLPVETGLLAVSLLEDGAA